MSHEDLFTVSRLGPASSGSFGCQS